RLLVIGHGPHRPALEEHARVLGIAESVVWAGYHEDDLPEHYRAADALFFTAAGSDEGHRAILEAMACGVPPVSAPIEGVAALLGRCAERLIAPAPEAEAIARCAATLLSGEEGPVRRSVEELSRAFGYEHAAQRLLDGYALVGARG
ncbi:MAG TPA: glycosyltransferase, partial [Thermoanaerobaculia bacterium]|nr:glycosyltransferase [Thermoanaerobaculia bacterium]